MRLISGKKKQCFFFAVQDDSICNKLLLKHIYGGREGYSGKDL